MSLSAQQLRDGVDALAQAEPGFARARALAGYPEPRIRPTGYKTMLRTIVGQQVSVAAASTIWGRVEALVGEEMAVDALLATSFDDLRACGLSRQKQSYLRSLCELVSTGTLDFEALPENDEKAIAQLIEIKGVGRWSAEIYLLFAEGRPDIWPAGDLAVQVGVGKILGLADRPSEKQTRELAESWRPHRGAAAIMTWHCYNNAAL